MSKLYIYTDGWCRNNQSDNNIGAWSYMMEWKEYINENSKAYRNTTNNIMELMAIIEALKAVKNKDVEIELFQIVLIALMALINGDITGKGKVGEKLIKNQLEIKNYGLN